MTHRFHPSVRISGATLLVAVALMGCRGDPAKPMKGAVFPLPPNPVQVTVTRDSSRSASATVAVSGGTLTTVGSDGSHFTLTIPPKALDGDTTIIMTPVSTIDGLPMSGGLVAAVHLEPEGLRFNTPVTLRIEPARQVPVEQQVGFGYLGDGADLHLYPLDKGRAFTLRLLHFSGGGVAAGTQGDVRALQQRAPADATAQLEQQIADVWNERNAQLTGGQGDPEFGTKLSNLLQDFYDHVVEPKIDAAKTTDDWRVMFDAVQTAIYYARVSEMMGEDAEALSKLLPIMEPILVHAFDRAYYHCIRKVGGEKEATMLMIITRHAALTIFGVDPNGPRFSQSKIDKCTAGGTVLPDSLELSFESAFEFDISKNTKATMKLGSTLKLYKTGGTTTYDARNWTPIVYRNFDFTGGGDCTSYTNPKANDGLWRVELMVHPDGKIGMTWSFNALEGVPTEQMTIVHCPESGGHPQDTFARWWWACLNQISSQDVEQAIEQGKGYIGLATGMTLFPAPGILAGHIERKDFMCKQAVIDLRLKVLG
jgi:hypothetical protein